MTEPARAEDFADEEEAFFREADCWGIETGRDWGTGRRADPEGGDLRRRQSGERVLW